MKDTFKLSDKKIVDGYYCNGFDKEGFRIQEECVYYREEDIAEFLRRLKNNIKREYIGGTIILSDLFKEIDTLAGEIKWKTLSKNKIIVR